MNEFPNGKMEFLNFVFGDAISFMQRNGISPFLIIFIGYGAYLYFSVFKKRPIKWSRDAKAKIALGFILLAFAVTMQYFLITIPELRGQVSANQ